MDLCVYQYQDPVRSHGCRCLKISAEICPDISQPKSGLLPQKVQNLSGLGSSLGRDNPGSSPIRQIPRSVKIFSSVATSGIQFDGTSATHRHVPESVECYDVRIHWQQASLLSINGRHR